LCFFKQKAIFSEITGTVLLLYTCYNVLNIIHIFCRARYKPACKIAGQTGRNGKASTTKWRTSRRVWGFSGSMSPRGFGPGQGYPQRPQPRGFPMRGMQMSRGFGGRFLPRGRGLPGRGRLPSMFGGRYGMNQIPQQFHPGSSPLRGRPGRNLFRYPGNRWLKKP